MHEEWKRGTQEEREIEPEMRLKICCINNTMVEKKIEVEKHP
jgi:hypothetical protein